MTFNMEMENAVISIYGKYRLRSKAETAEEAGANDKRALFN